MGLTVEIMIEFSRFIRALIIAFKSNVNICIFSCLFCSVSCKIQYCFCLNIRNSLDMGDRISPLLIWCAYYQLLKEMCSPPSRETVKDEWSCTATPPICLHGFDRDKCTFAERHTHNQQKNMHVYA